jgi:eukaryotic-like serine/threonine-protein kinase
MTFETGTTIGGKYKLEREIARGGMGAIWRAHHVELEVPVAVKIVSAELALSQTALSRFKQEAKAAAQLRSPHVVQILDYGIEAGAPFMVMELLKGEDLATAIANTGRLGLGRVCEIASGVCKALRLAHEAQIVHRDLKPENIFLTKVGDDEVVKVLDFGIAKALTSDTGLVQTGSATLIGSPLYMSPEQSRGEPIDTRTDLWSLAVVLFEALTGDPPFIGKGLGDVFAQICLGETPLPSSRGILIPGLDDFFRRALAKDREERFATAREFYEALIDCHETAPTSRLLELRGAQTVIAQSTTIAPPTQPSKKLVATQDGISAEIKLARRAVPKALWVAGLAAGVLGAGVTVGLYRSSGAANVGAGSSAIAAESTPSSPTSPQGPGPDVSVSSATVAQSMSAGPERSAAPATSSTAVASVSAPGPIKGKSTGTTAIPTAPAPIPTATAKTTTRTDDIFGVPQPK